MLQTLFVSLLLDRFLFVFSCKDEMWITLFSFCYLYCYSVCFTSNSIATINISYSHNNYYIQNYDWRLIKHELLVYITFVTYKSVYLTAIKRTHTDNWDLNSFQLTYIVFLIVNDNDYYVFIIYSRQQYLIIHVPNNV